MHGDDFGAQSSLGRQHRQIVRTHVKPGIAFGGLARGQAQRPAFRHEHAGMHASVERVGAADEIEHERGSRLAVDFVGRADLFDPPIFQHHDAVGQFHGFFLVVGDEQRGLSGLFVQSPQPAPQFDPHLGVERAERFVQQQHRGIDRQGAGQRDALLLSAGQLFGVAAAELGQLHQLQQFVDAARDRRLIGPPPPRPAAQAERDVLGHRHVLEQRVMLEHETDVAFAQAEPGRVVFAEQDLAAVGMQQSGDHPQQRGLARTGRAEQRDQLAGRHVQVDRVERGDVRVVLAELTDFQVHAVVGEAVIRVNYRRVVQ